MMISQDVYNYIEDHTAEALELLIQLAQIPAPSHPGKYDLRTELFSGQRSEEDPL